MKPPDQFYKKNKRLSKNKLILVHILMLTYNLKNNEKKESPEDDQIYKLKFKCIFIIVVQKTCPSHSITL